MAFLHHRPRSIDRISDRVERLGERAANVLAREEHMIARLEELRSTERQPTGRLRCARRARAIKRATRSLERLRAKRAAFVQKEIHSIMSALQEQSRRTRERLDRELDRLLPIEAEWERLRSTFDALEAVVRQPAVEALAGQWKGVLSIPDFPVHEREGYAKPFPQQALMF